MRRLMFGAVGVAFLGAGCFSESSDLPEGPAGTSTGALVSEGNGDGATEVADPSVDDGPDDTAADDGPDDDGPDDDGPDDDGPDDAATTGSTVQCPACSTGFCTDDGECARGIFVSSAHYNGDLGGLTGADMVCDNLAGSAGFAGDWMAWLSNSNLDAGQRIPGWSNPYVLPDGTRVADGFSVLTTYISIDATYLAHAIDMTEAGDYPDPGTACPGSGGIPVWTSTDTLGRWDGYGTCADWTSDELFTESADEVNLGDASATNSFWTVFWCDDYDCSHTASLYCIQINDN